MNQTQTIVTKFSTRASQTQTIVNKFSTRASQTQTIVNKFSTRASQTQTIVNKRAVWGVGGWGEILRCMFQFCRDVCDRERPEASFILACDWLALHNVAADNFKMEVEREESAPSKDQKTSESDAKQQTIGWQSLLTFTVLSLAWLVGFSSRLFAVIRFESIIHEFDPW